MSNILTLEDIISLEAAAKVQLEMCYRLRLKMEKATSPSSTTKGKLTEMQKISLLSNRGKSIIKQQSKK